MERVRERERGREGKGGREREREREREGKTGRGRGDEEPSDDSSVQIKHLLMLPYSVLITKINFGHNFCFYSDTFVVKLCQIPLLIVGGIPN